MTVDIAAVDISGNLEKYHGGLNAHARYASFDYCFNYFQEAREDGETARLAERHLQLSCLQLGFYLASWGMVRGSSGLLQRSVRGLVPVVEQIAQEPASIWDLDVHNYGDNTDAVLALSERVRQAFLTHDGFWASDTLVTKTMLGVFGCVPAFDRYFRMGFGPATLNPKTLKKIGDFYKDNQAEIDAAQVFTLDFDTGRPTERPYPRAKIMDAVFFQQGYSPS